MDFMYSIFGFFAAGGTFMFPILLVAAVGAAIAIERYVTLTLVRQESERLESGPALARRAATSTRRGR